MNRARWMLLLAGVGLIAASCASDDVAPTTMLADLEEPRGLLLDADSGLCVVEAGSTLNAGDSAASGTEYQNDSGAVTCVDADLGRRRITAGLPYANNRFSGVSVGATDLAVMNGSIYVLLGEGFDDTSRTILQLDETGGSPQVVADFLAYTEATTSPDFFDEIIIFSNPFAFVADPANRRFLVTDGATGQVLSAGLDGAIDVYSEVEGHEVLTGLALTSDGSLFVTSFSQLPHTRGTGSIVQVDSDGTSHVVLDDLTTPIDLAFDSRGQLYVIEFVDASDPVRPYEGDSGRLLRFDQRDGGWGQGQVLLDDLPHPTALLIGPDDEIYISVSGAFSDPRSGSVVRLDGLTAG